MIIQNLIHFSFTAFETLPWLYLGHILHCSHCNVLAKIDRKLRTICGYHLTSMLANQNQSFIFWHLQNHYKFTMFSKYVSIAGSNLPVFSSMETMLLEVGGIRINLINVAVLFLSRYFLY